MRRILLSVLALNAVVLVGISSGQEIATLFDVGPVHQPFFMPLRTVDEFLNGEPTPFQTDMLASGMLARGERPVGLTGLREFRSLRDYVVRGQ